MFAPSRRNAAIVIAAISILPLHGCAGPPVFRYGDFGTERALTDVAGVMLGTVQIPFESGAPDCYEDAPVLRYDPALVCAW